MDDDSVDLRANMDRCENTISLIERNDVNMSVDYPVCSICASVVYTNKCRERSKNALISWNC